MIKYLSSSRSNSVPTCNNPLTKAIYKTHLSPSDENFVVAPFCVEVSLGLLRWVTEGDIAHEISMAIPGIPEKTSDCFKVVKEAFAGVNTTDVELKQMAKIYLHHSLAVRKDFRKQMGAFKVTIELLNFHEESKAAEKISDWILMESGGKMMDVCREEHLSRDVLMILVSALYLKVNFLKQRQRDYIFKKEFYTSPDDSVIRTFMEKTGTFLYLEDEELKAKVIRMPLHKKSLQMTIILPNEKDGLPAIEESIETVFCIRNLTQERVLVQLPAFKIENKLDKIHTVLENIGVRSIFKETTDFSKLLTENSNISVDSVLQYVCVDFGYEVQRGFSVIKLVGVEKTFNPKYKVFIADHPFIFLLTSDDYIILTGRVFDPVLT